MDKVCVVGLGYVGLPTAIVAAQAGHHVVGYDIDSEKVACINAGMVTGTEVGLQERLKNVLESGKFCATTVLGSAEYFIIAVPTPTSVHKGADLSYVYAAINSVMPHLKTGDTVIVESTIPIGTTDLVAQIIQQKTKFIIGQDIFVAHAPERVWPSNVFHEIVYNDRVVGGVTAACAQRTAQFYKTFVNGHIHVQSAQFAEMAKLLENSAIDVNVALAHQIAAIAEALNFDPYEVISVVNRHPRVKVLTPTCGVGGHCVAVDPWFLINHMPDKTPLLQAARLVNDKRPLAVIKKIKEAAHTWCRENQKDQCVVHALGLTYKPNVDDLRESPAITVIEELRKDEKIKLLVSEPHVERERLREFESELCSLEEGLSRTDLVAVLVGHTVWLDIFDRVQPDRLLDFSGLTLRRINTLVGKKESDQQNNCFVKNEKECARSL